jgi:streptogrisin C
MNRLAPLAGLLCAIISCPSAFGTETTETAPTPDPAVLAEVEALYGISEDAAVSRLAKEFAAAETARYIEGRNLSNYVGSWFDPVSMSLMVATTDAADSSAIRRAGAAPVVVTHSLADLEAAQARLNELLATSASLRTVSIDVPTNALVVGATDVTEAARLIGDAQLDVEVRVELVPDTDNGFSSNLLGADRTRNFTWPLDSHGQKSPCSVGASAEKVNGATYTAGYATAGHCGQTGNSIVANDGVTSVGTVMQSTYNYTTGTATNNEDGGWVQTLATWTTQPQINGYTSGVLNVSGTWAGLLFAPVGTTVCRYGATSGGPHCGQITSRTATYSPTSSITLYNMIKVHSMCVEPGDSGGPLVMTGNQVQGTVTGSLNPQDCSIPYSTFDVYFQPIGTTLARAQTSLSVPAVAMLTSHGRSAPTIPLFQCPDAANSGTTGGSHIYACDIPNFDSQGNTTISWTSSTGASSTSSELDGSCTVPGPAVSVTLTITNPYGSLVRTASFACPTKPLP